MTPLELAQRLVGEVAERPGPEDHPAIHWFHETALVGRNVPDEVPWCSSFANWVAWMCRLPRSKSAAARSWLNVGISIRLDQARPGYDVVVFKRGTNPQQGHVAFFAGMDGDKVHVVGGNQSNNITQASFPVADVLGVRRLAVLL